MKKGLIDGVTQKRAAAGLGPQRRVAAARYSIGLFGAGFGLAGGQSHAPKKPRSFAARTNQLAILANGLAEAGNEFVKVANRFGSRTKPFSAAPNSFGSDLNAFVF